MNIKILISHEVNNKVVYYIYVELSYQFKHICFFILLEKTALHNSHDCITPLLPLLDVLTLTRAPLFNNLFCSDIAAFNASIQLHLSSCVLQQYHRNKIEETK